MPSYTGIESASLLAENIEYDTISAIFFGYFLLLQVGDKTKALELAKAGIPEVLN